MSKKAPTLFKQSLRAILTNKGRSFLTVLGIIIGISSVIALISMGEGVNRSIKESVEELGATNLFIASGGEVGPRFGDEESRDRGDFNPGNVSTLTLNDLNSLSDTSNHPDVEAVSGIISTSSIVQRLDIQKRLSINGVSRSYLDISNLEIEAGRLFDSDDEAGRQKVAVIGHELAQEFFGDSNPVGEMLSINQNDFLIIGYLAEAPESLFENPNRQVFIPLTTAGELAGTTTLSNILVKIVSEEAVPSAKTKIEANLLANHGITDVELADFAVVSPEDVLSAITQITGLLTSLLAGIAGISLVVGGIGIMNIMLVSVTERTREIGLRKAVGARTSDILLQFLIESLILTVMGGIIGILLGYGIGLVFSQFVDFQPVVTLFAIILAVGVSSLIGLVFGLYPALKAAKLNPIDALRYE